MLHKLFGLSLFLALLLFTPVRCARGRLGLHYFHHAQHHHLHQLHSPKTNTDPNSIINIHMVTDKKEEGSIEPNTFMWAPGHMATTNNVEVPTYAGDESTGVPAQVADSMSIMGIPNSASVSESGRVSGPNLDPNPTAIKRSLLDPLSNSDDTLQGMEDLNLFLASLTIQKDNSLFSMLPRGPVPPSGPSKNHNSALTDNHS